MKLPAKRKIRTLSNLELIDLKALKKSIVLFVDDGGRGGLSALDHLIEKNTVTVISTDYTIGELINLNLRTPL